MERINRFQDIDFLEDEFSKIYYDLIDCKEVSVFQKYLMYSKMLKIGNEYEKVVNEIMDNDRKNNALITKKLKVSMVIAILTLLLIFVAPIFTIPMAIFQVYNLKKIDYLKGQTMNKSEYTRFSEKVHGIKNILDNISTFIAVKEHARIEKMHLEREQNFLDALSINVANSFLETFFNSDMDLNEQIWISPQVANALVKILQEDLHTEENNLMNLLGIAKEKMQAKELEEEIALKLTR